MTTINIQHTMSITNTTNTTNIQHIWDKISNTVANSTTKLVYFGIGSSMVSYKEITSSNNQQYPCFLDKFEGNKTVVLFDTRLETPLKIEEHFEKTGDCLDMVDSTLSVNGEFYFREFQNKSGSVKVFAINDYFNFEHTNYLDKVENKNHNDNVDITISNMFNLIGICLGKHIRTKFLLQDYTGRSTMNFYSSLLRSFDRDEMLSNIIFDVTQRDPGCSFDIKPEYPTLDEYNDLVQENYMQLMKIRKYSLFDHIIKQRIDQLVYPVTLNYINLTNETSFELAGIDKIVNLCMIYSIEFNNTIKKNEAFIHRDYLLAKFMELIKIMLTDIVRSQDCDSSYIDHFIQLLFNRNEFINSISVLKYSDK